MRHKRYSENMTGRPQETIMHKVYNNIKIDFENRFWQCGLSQNVA